MYDPHTKESRGFAFVTMATSEEADAAIASLNGTELGGKTMRVEKVREPALPSVHGRRNVDLPLLCAIQGPPWTRPHPDPRKVLRPPEAG